MCPTVENIDFRSLLKIEKIAKICMAEFFWKPADLATWVHHAYWNHQIQGWKPRAPRESRSNLVVILECCTFVIPEGRGENAQFSMEISAGCGVFNPEFGDFSKHGDLMLPNLQVSKKIWPFQLFKIAHMINFGHWFRQIEGLERVYLVQFLARCVFRSRTTTVTLDLIPR